MFPWDILITGAVGLAGIGGTLWQGKRAREAQTADLKASLDATAENLKAGINAENERARLAEKRRVYAGLNAALNNYSRLGRAIYLDPSLPLNPTELDDAQARIFDATSEVIFIAPRQVRDLAIDIANQTLAFTRDVQQDRSTKFPDETWSERGRLVGELRADLGETE